MKLPWEKKHFSWALVAFFTVAASVAFYMLLQKWSVVWGAIGVVADILRPITYGLILAYLLNPLMGGIEKKIVLPVIRKIFKKTNVEIHSPSRVVAIVVTWLIVAVFVFSLSYLVVPEFILSIERIVERIPEYVEHLLVWFDGLLVKQPGVYEFLSKTVSGFATDITVLFNKFIGAVPDAGTILLEVSSSVYSIFVAICNVFIGIIVSFYVLKDKEKFLAQFKKIVYSVLNLKHANGMLYVLRLTHEKFGNFIVGKIFDSIIIGILCFLLLEVFDVSYSLLISVVVGVTNVIPFFGPFIGAIPSAILILCVDPIECLTFVIIILLLQQFDGNILGPKILGSTTGVSSFWVLASILVGSGLFGIWGMVCAVPFFAVAYTLVRRACNTTLKRKGMDYSTESFERIEYIDEKTKAPVWKNQE